MMGAERNVLRDVGLRDAIKAAGSLRGLARGLGITASAVSQWTRIPSDRVLEVEAVTKIPRQRLRPDIFVVPHHGGDVEPSPASPRVFIAYNQEDLIDVEEMVRAFTRVLKQSFRHSERCPFCGSPTPKK
jgi:hypothetical protein